jgi:hypothetical protein
VRAPLVRRVAEAQGAERLINTTDLIFMHRNNPIMQQAFQYKELGKFYAEQAARADHEDILESVARWEGSAAVPLAQHWLQRQPDAWVVVRGDRGVVWGAICCLQLGQVIPDDVAADPAAQAAMQYIQRHAPLRSGDVALLGRFLVDREKYQQPTAVLNALQIAITSKWLTTPNLAWSLVYYAQPEYWLTLMSYINFHRASDADYVIGGRRYGVFAHDSA